MGDQNVELERIESQADQSVNSNGEQKTQLSDNNTSQRIDKENEITTATGNSNSKKKGDPKDSKAMLKVKKIVGIIILVSFFIISLGLTMGILWPGIFEEIAKKELILSPTSKTYKMWKETPIPMYLKIYLYNWTNHELAKNPYVKPHFNQMGPYVFREVDFKENQVWNQNNGTITFLQKRQWHFEPSMSNGSLSDRVTNLNPIGATIAYVVRHANELKKFLVDKALKTEPYVITKTVNQLLFEGYDDLLLKVIVDLNLTGIPFDKFAWFYGRNDSSTYDGVFNMLVGNTSLYDVGIIKEWKYSKISKYYSKSCGEIRGTNGDLWPPLPDNKTVSVFSPDTCTTMSLVADGESSWLGLTGSKYISNSDMFDNGTNVPSRKCYCEGVECQPSGTLNVSSCKFGAPAFVSLPHFYLADPSYREKISGMNPNKEDHEFRLVVQPVTGTPMQVRAALQINFLVQPDKSLSYYKNFPKMYVPMIWFTQEANLTPEFASQIKILVLLLPLGSGLLFALAAIGFLLVAISIFLYFRQKMIDDQNVRLLPKERQRIEKETEVTLNNEE